MKIVHVVYSLEVGGAESLVMQLARLQRSRGHEVSVICQSRLGVLGERMVGEGFRVDVVGTGNPLARFPRWWRLFRELRPEVVHCHNPAPTIQAASAARMLGARAVLSTRHSLVAPPYHRKEETLYGIAALFCDRIVGICEATCANLRGAPMAQPSKIVRVYNGAAPVTATEGLPDDEQERLETTGTTFLFVGRLAAVKDLPTMVRAFALARERAPELRLWVVGDGAERVRLEALAAELGLAEKGGGITFWGERHDVPRFLLAADVFTMSSVSEGLPISLLQAMSAGLPALVTDVGGMAEVVQNAGCGLRTPVGEVAAMADGMVRIGTDAGLRAKFARNGRRAYAESFTLERMDEAYEALYRARRSS